MNQILPFLCLSAIGALAACSPGPMAPVTTPVSVRQPRHELAVLFIGNSYSFGVPKAFAKLAAERGKTVRVDQVTYSGWSLARHAASEETLRKIHERRWDVVVLQEQSRLPSLPARRALMMVPPLRKLAVEARNQGSTPLLYQTWGYRDGDRKRFHDDFHAMTRRVRDGYQTAAGKAGGLAVVPAGDAWEREVSAGHADRLFMPDGSHPTPQGNALTAKVFFETLFPASQGN